MKSTDIKQFEIELPKEAKQWLYRVIKDAERDFEKSQQLAHKAQITLREAVNTICEGGKIGLVTKKRGKK